MELIDWEEIKQELGDDAWRDDFVYLPRQSRILLSKFVQDDRFLFPDKKQVYYGPDSQEELYNAAKIAYNSLMSPITIQQVNEVNYAMLAASSMPLGFPGLVGFWQGATNGLARAIDQSGNELHLTATSAINGNSDSVPFYEFTPYSYLQYPTLGEPFDIIGNEVHQNKGVTIGAWVNRDNATRSEGIIGKKSSGVYGYGLLAGNGNFSASFGGPGPVSATVTSAKPSISNVWSFVAATWNPGQGIAIFHDDIKTSSATALSELGTVSVPFMIGMIYTMAFDGKISRPFVCSAVVPDNMLMAYFDATYEAYNG